MVMVEVWLLAFIVFVGGAGSFCFKMGSEAWDEHEH